MQSEGSAGTREVGMLQSVLTWKNRDQNPQLKVLLSPHSALGLYYSLCSASLQPALFLSYFSSALLDCEASLSWKGAVRDSSNPHSTTPHAVGSWKGKLLELETSSLAFLPPPQPYIPCLQPGKQILHRGHWFISCHALVKQPWTEVEAHKQASSIRGP